MYMKSAAAAVMAQNRFKNIGKVAAKRQDSCNDVLNKGSGLEVKSLKYKQSGIVLALQFA